MSEATTREFLARLWALQAEAGLNNAQLARILGADPSYVWHLKSGRRSVRLGLKYVLAAVARFPELAVFLTRDVPTITTDVPKGTGDKDV